MVIKILAVIHDFIEIEVAHVSDGQVVTVRDHRACAEQKEVRLSAEMVESLKKTFTVLREADKL